MRPYWAVPLLGERSVLLNDENLLRNVIVQLHASEDFELLPHIAFTIGAAGSGLLSRFCGGLYHGLGLTVEPAIRDGMLPGVQHSFLFAHTVSFQHKQSIRWIKLYYTIHQGRCQLTAVPAPRLLGRLCF